MMQGDVERGQVTEVISMIYITIILTDLSGFIQSLNSSYPIFYGINMINFTLRIN